MNILYLIGGLVLVILGANGLVDGSSSIAKRFRISSFVIGLTIVGFGTSTPELSVSILSALKGSADLSVGNVIGSNLFNTLFIVGCTALVAPIVITRNTLLRGIPLCILASVVVLICGNDILLDHAQENVFSMTDGLIMLCFFIIFIAYTIAITRKSTEQPIEDEIKVISWWKSTLFILAGLAALILGGKLIVMSAIGLARGWGISESVIGVTVVAIGTSLPELATSIVAAMKKNPEIAVGNILGSNIFNIFFILGCSATIRPLHATGITNFDYLWLVGASILMWLFGIFFGKRTIMRSEGTIMILAWVVYITWVIIRM